MEHVSDQVRNPFGVRYPGPAVPGYGPPSADFHVVGDHPGRHGGRESGVPFTGSTAGERVQQLLTDAGLLRTSDDPPVPDDVFLSYLHPCVEPATEQGYRRLERYFDAELRAVNAHILVTTGERATREVVDSYTAQARKLADRDLHDLHATEVHGYGFLVVPLLEPVEWTEADHEEAVERLRSIRERDYRQTKGVATRIG